MYYIFNVFKLLIKQLFCKHAWFDFNPDTDMFLTEVWDGNFEKRLHSKYRGHLYCSICKKRQTITSGNNDKPGSPADLGYKIYLRGAKVLKSKSLGKPELWSDNIKPIRLLKLVEKDKDK